MGVFDIADRVIDGVKKVREIEQKIHDADLQNAIAELMLSAVDLKAQLVDVRRENIDLQEQLNQLKKRDDLRKLIQKNGNYYYLSNPPEGYSKGPYCMTCFDEDGRLITTIETYQGVYECTRCNRRRK